MREWWKYDHKKYDEAIWHNDCIEEDADMTKVIFLDIDGVLNDDYRTKEYVHEEKVKLLKYIVDKTNAKIVLSSSWRFSYRLFVEKDYKSNESAINLLHELFTKYGIVVDGITPGISSGPNARPLEIKVWLAARANVKRFVILDDDTFWRWGWLARFFVCTNKRVVNENGWTEEYRGLTQEFADRAIEILNAKYDYENIRIYKDGKEVVED